jgi:hypothetical protein
MQLRSANRQRSGASADHPATTFPRNIFLHGQRGVSKGVAKLFGYLLLSLANRAAVDHHIVFVRDAVYPD